MLNFAIAFTIEQTTSLFFGTLILIGSDANSTMDNFNPRLRCAATPLLADDGRETDFLKLITIEV